MIKQIGYVFIVTSGKFNNSTYLDIVIIVIVFPSARLGLPCYWSVEDHLGPVVNADMTMGHVYVFFYIVNFSDDYGRLNIVASPSVL